MVSLHGGGLGGDVALDISRDADGRRAARAVLVRGVSACANLRLAYNLLLELCRVLRCAMCKPQDEWRNTSPGIVHAHGDTHTPAAQRAMERWCTGRSCVPGPCACVEQVWVGDAPAGAPAHRSLRLDPHLTPPRPTLHSASTHTFHTGSRTSQWPVQPLGSTTVSPPTQRREEPSGLVRSARFCPARKKPGAMALTRGPGRDGSQRCGQRRRPARVHTVAAKGSHAVLWADPSAVAMLGGFIIPHH